MTTSLAQLLTASRAFGLRNAIVARLKAEFVGVEVKSWPGRLNVQDMVAKTSIAPPSILVAITGQPPVDQMMAGQHHEPVELTAYIAAENRSVDFGEGKRAVYGDELGLALCNGLMRFLASPDARWGIDDVGHPDEAKAGPVYTLGGLENGLAYFGVTWRQTVYGQGQPLYPASEGPLPDAPPFVPGLYPPGSDVDIGQGDVADEVAG